VLTALLATLLTALAGWAIPQLILYGAIAVGAGVIFAVLARRVRIAALDVLIYADRVCGFHAALSTAYEYLRQHTTNPFVPGLASMAEQLAPQVEAHRVFPRRLPRRVWGIPLLLAATLGLSMLQLTPLHFAGVPEPEVARHVSREGQRLEKWGRSLEELAKREQLHQSMILARQMQQLGQRLQREGSEKAQVSERIATLSQYLQRLQQELRERALLSDPGLMAARDVLTSGKSVKQELRDILQLLQHDEVPREMLATAEQSVQRLSRQVGQNAQLENLLQNLRAGDVDAARQLLRDVLQQQQAAEEVEHLDRARRALEYSSRSIQRGPQGDPSTNRSRSQADTPSHGQMDMDEDGMFSDQMPGMDDFPSPGAEEGYGSSTLARQSPNPALRESDQPASNVDVSSGEGAMRLSYIRYLPIQNQAQVPLEQAVVQYQHAAEEVLTQEQIPRGYREQIKQYFMSLGMMK
jgi:predicted ArsR family transcriptional regulator